MSSFELRVRRALGDLVFQVLERTQERDEARAELAVVKARLTQEAPAPAPEPA